MAQYEDFEIDQGTDVNVQLELTNPNGTKKDLVGHTVNAYMKKSFSTPSSEAIQFNTQIQTPSTDGVVNLQLSNTQTDNLKAGRYVYDVELSFLDSAGNTLVERILEGQVIVKPSVTR
jgi:hypothetical protein